MVRAVQTYLTLLLALALPSTALCGEDPAEGAKLKVVDIRAEGLIRVPPETLLGVANIAKGDSLTQAELTRRTRQSIRSMFAIGYFTDVNVYRKDPAPGEIELTVVVKEKYVVRKLNLVGHDEIEEEDIRKAFSIKEGRFLDSTKLVATLRSVEELYQDKGFYLAEASWEVEKEEATRTAVVTIRIKEQAEVEIRKVVFVGNKELPDDDLKAFMQTREKGYLSFMQQGGLFLNYFFQGVREPTASGAPLQRDEIDASQFESWSAHQDIDLQRVKWLYMTRGYVDVKLGQPRISLTPDGQGIVITIDIHEGRKFTVGGVEIVTDDTDGLLFDKDELKGRLELTSEQVFNSEDVMKDTMLLQRKYKDKGFAFVSVSNTPYLDRENGILDLTYVVEKGQPAYIASIELEGNKSTCDKVIRREMKIAEGDLYEQSKIDRSKALIFRLGFFENVEIINRPALFSPGIRKPGSEEEEVGYVDLIVKVKERETGIFQVGAGFSSLESYLLQARISKNNFLGRRQTIGVQALGSSLRNIYMLSFVEPYFLDTRVSLSLDLYKTAIDYDAFTTDSLGGNLSWGYRLLDDYFVYLTYKLEEKDTTIGGRRGFSVPVKSFIPEGLTSSLRLSVAWDTRNNRIIPTDGFYNSASMEYASPYLGGDSDFYRTIFNTRWYVPLVWNFILRLNGTAGYVNSPSEAGVPLFERFYVGGIFSVRGFHRNALSPTVPAAASNDPGTTMRDFPIGGNKQLIFNAEIEIPIFRQMGIVGVVFLDAGNAFAEEEAMSLVDLRTSSGFGFRWWSPMGPLRFEWGFPLDPQPGEEPMVFEFTIGSAF